MKRRSERTMTTTTVRNGVDVDHLVGTIEAITGAT
jgi:hypothetical protein